MTNRCIYCGDTRLFFTTNDVLQCYNCSSLVCPDSAPPYQPDYHAYRWSWLRPKLWFLGWKAFQNGLTVRSPGTVCDLGCGAGHSLWWANHCSWITVGHDIAAPVKASGIDYFEQDAAALLRDWKGQVDLVWCWHTIEHLDNPKSLIALAAQLVAPKGRIYFEFPEANAMLGHGLNNLYRRAIFPEHRGIPSLRWAQGEAEKLGLRILKAAPPKDANWMYGRPFRKTTAVNVCLAPA